MTFEPLSNVSFGIYFLNIMLSFCIPIIVCLTFYHIGKKFILKKEKDMTLSRSLNQEGNENKHQRSSISVSTLGFSMAILGASIIIIISIFGMIGDHNTEKANGETLLNNIQQKYTISDMVWSNTGAEIQFKNLDYINNKKIEVTTDDGQRVNFMLKVDKDTFEPTLSNPAIDGGAAKSVGIGADDIKRK